MEPACLDNSLESHHWKERSFGLISTQISFKWNSFDFTPLVSTVTFKEISFEFISDIVAFNEEPIPLVLWFPTSMIKKSCSRESVMRWLLVVTIGKLQDELAALITGF